MHTDINWLEYFEHIKKVCPWSYAAYKKGQVKIREWDGEWEHLNKNQALVYIVKNTNRRRLKKLCKKLDLSEDYKWLWSEPKYGEYASPCYILIQQDRVQLYEARLSINYYD